MEGGLVLTEVSPRAIRSDQFVGIVRVCCRSVATAGVGLARILSGDRPTSSGRKVVTRIFGREP
jgi:hypothetical protein